MKNTIVKKPYCLKSSICLVLMYVILSVICFIKATGLFSSFFNYIATISYILIDGLGCVIMSYIYSNYIFNFSNKSVFISQFSSNRLEKAKSLNSKIKIITLTVCVISIFVLLMFKNTDKYNAINLSLQFVYLGSMALYKTFYLDIITSFGEQGFINKRSYITYNDISSIKELQTKKYGFDYVIVFEIYHGKDLIKKCRLVSQDYYYLLRRLSNNMESN